MYCPFNYIFWSILGRNSEAQARFIFFMITSIPSSQQTVVTDLKFEKLVLECVRYPNDIILLMISSYQFTFILSLLKYKNRRYVSMPKMNECSISNEDWAHILFVKYPYLFLPELEKLLGQSEEEVDGLCRIFEEFNVDKKSRILDLSCGIGRHAIPLAKRGFQVVGYDPSSFYLQKAQQRANSEVHGNKKCITFYVGEIDLVAEILSLNREGEFNAIISMFNSIGYATTEHDFKLFKDVLSLGATGAILITETDNRDYHIRNFLPYVNYDFDKLRIYESWKFNLEKSTAEGISKFYEKYGNNNNYLRLLLDLPVQMRLYSLHELKDLINKSGWVYQKSYGSVKKLNSATFDSRDIVTVSKKLD